VAPVNEELLALFLRAPITGYIGQQLTACDAGMAEIHLPHKRELEQSFGITHGGLVATIADTAGFFAAASLAGANLATVEFKINLVAPARNEALHAKGTVVHRGGRLSVCQVTVTSQSGTIVALAQATYTTIGSASPASP